MKIHNIVNYFVVPPLQKGEMPRVFKAPVTINEKVARDLLQKQMQKTDPDFQLPRRPMLHVSYDTDSKRIYVPNASKFDSELMNNLLQAAQIRISKDYQGYSNSEPISGSPFSLIRARSVESFTYASELIAEKMGVSETANIPVIEANLDRMPSTRKHLPEIFSAPSYVGGYVSPSFASTIKFIEEIDITGSKKSQPILLLTQNTPFILINISGNVDPNGTDKERVVVSGYRDYLYDESIDEYKYIHSNLAQTSTLYTAKHHMYLGWPFEEVCEVIMKDVAHVSDFKSAMGVADILVQASSSLESEGYNNPASIPYYLTFQIDYRQFPLNIDSIMTDGQIDASKQIPFFKIVEYDPDTSFIIIETPIYFSPDLAMKIFKAKSYPVITRYNRSVNSIDVKSQSTAFDTLKRNNPHQVNKLRALSVYDASEKFEDVQDNKNTIDFRTDNRASGVSLSNPHICHLRHISDYYYAYDFINNMCERRGVEFVDLTVLVGPVERIMGRGTKGGFIDSAMWEKNGMKNPHEIEKGLWVSPPLIAVDSLSAPSYAQQTATLIHEYSHNIFSTTNPYHEHEYLQDPQLKEKDSDKFWSLYLGDEDERKAHIEEIKYQLKSGDSADEIIRNKIGGRVTQENYKISLLFRELVDEAIRQLEQEDTDNEDPTGES